MNCYVTGEIIKEFREKEKLTQAQLADKLMVSNKTISKWETGKGLPDISLLESLAEALNVSLIELMSGDLVENKNLSANMKKTVWYVCPVCGNTVYAQGEAVVSCCGITLPKLEGEEAEGDHDIIIERVDNEYMVSIKHPMEKNHYITFIAYRSYSGVQLVKLYPESDASCRFRISGHGTIFAYCNHHGLFSKKL